MAPLTSRPSNRPSGFARECGGGIKGWSGPGTSVTGGATPEPQWRPDRPLLLAAAA